jgi:hypothetical protein
MQSNAALQAGLEEVVWMGQSAKRIVDLLAIWDAHKENADEAFWQATLSENVYALSQLFAVPLVFVGESAYVGGMGVDRKSAKLVDYLFSHESSKEAVLVEIKTPTAALLGKAYRGTFRPSSELAGAVMQVLDYRKTLAESFRLLNRDDKHELQVFAPKCVVLVGNGTKELSTQAKRTAFELFRSNSSMVEVVTYDELFRKLEVLATLFSLVRKTP